ncbi:MAG: nucleotide exchange factor GrpE [Bacteroidetes bacterium]|nr:nucleotide exchange factor GrpE [Bacteroidota bacterium]
MQEENNDFEFEDVTEDGAVSDKLKKLRSELKLAKEESQTNLDGWQRARADYANLQKTSSDQMKELRGYVLEGFVEELLPSLDAFEMAMRNKETWEAVNENWRKGIEYIYSQLKAILTNNGISEVGMVGEKFNPDFHQALEEVETSDENSDHTVAEVIQKGYKGSKGVIRPAQVKIFIKK